MKVIYYFGLLISVIGIIASVYTLLNNMELLYIKSLILILAGMVIMIECDIRDIKRVRS